MKNFIKNLLTQFILCIKNNRIIFLDIDGVLNSQEYICSVGEKFDNPIYQIDPNKILLINELIRKTKSKVVISSTWRIPFLPNDIHGMQSLLKSYGFIGEIIGLTPRKFTSTRAQEILLYLDSLNETCNYIIIDDDVIDLPFTIKTSFEKGLEKHHITTAINLFEKQIYEK